MISAQDPPRTATHGRPPVRIFREFDMRVGFDQWQHFLLHKLGVDPRHRVVLQPALHFPESISAPIANGNGNHGRNFVLLRNHTIQRRKQQLVWPVRTHNERCNRARHILLWHIHSHLPRVWRWMARRHHWLYRVCNISGNVRASITRNPRIDLAIRRFHRELNHRSLGNVVRHRRSRRLTVSRPNDEIPVHIRRRNRALRQLLRRHIPRTMRIARRRRRALHMLRYRRGTGRRLAKDQT